jgi:hypothetical protein
VKKEIIFDQVKPNMSDLNKIIKIKKQTNKIRMSIKEKTKRLQKNLNRKEKTSFFFHLNLILSVLFFTIAVVCWFLNYFY